MKKALIVLFSVSILFISGCWDRREINDLLMVVGVGMDLVDEAGANRIMLTSQISEPGSFGQGVGGGGTPKAKTFWTVSGTGPDERAAILQSFSRIPEPLFYGQDQVAVYGERLARYGIMPALDRGLRSREARRSIFMAVTRGEARKVMETEMPGSQPSGIALSSMFYLEGGTEDIMPVTRNDFAYALSTGVTSPVVPVVSVVPQNSVTAMDLKTPGAPLETLKVSGLAVFSADGKLLDFFNKEETLGLMLVRNKTKSRLVNVPSPVGGPGEPVSLGLVSSESEIKASIDETGLPGYEIRIRSLFDVMEDFGNLKGMDEPGYFDALAQYASDQIEKEIKAAVERAQALDADVFEFGEELRRQHRKEWVQLKGQWRQVFPLVKVTVKCDTGLRHRGQTVKSPGGFKES